MHDTIGDMQTLQSKEAVVLAGRYRIVRKLGEGGMGSVWLAEDSKLDGRQVAIKMLPSVLMADVRAVAQLKEEAKVAMRLSHPHIVTLRAFEESTEGAFLVMDYIAGRTLVDVIPEIRMLPIDQLLKKVGSILEPVAAAVDYAHTKNIVHRDIKPSNILMGSDGEVFVADFGLAREAKESLTRVTGRIASGTLPYMSPEQLRGETPSREQDVYSLAATLYECLAGVPPFSRGGIEYQIVNQDPEPLKITTDKTSSTWIPSGLEKEPLARPSSCTELYAEYLAFENSVLENWIVRTTGSVADVAEQSSAGTSLQEYEEQGARASDPGKIAKHGVVEGASASVPNTAKAGEPNIENRSALKVWLGHAGTALCVLCVIYGLADRLGWINGPDLILRSIEAISGSHRRKTGEAIRAIRDITLAAETYYRDIGRYPGSLSDLARNPVMERTGRVRNSDESEARRLRWKGPYVRKELVVRQFGGSFFSEPNEDGNDPWGTRYRYEPRAQSAPIVTSAGRDETFDTSDDIK